MKKIRKEGENLEEMLKELKIGDCPILDSATGYEITRVVGGFIYKNEYIGMVFVPEVEAVGTIKNSIAKTEPKKTITK
jgi:hypothetical protein